jgi:hypothetical protein
VDLQNLTLEDLNPTGILAAYWDTLGWVYYRQGKFDRAENYLRASWMITQGNTEADHLAEVLKQEHKSASLADSSTARTTKLPRIIPGEGHAEFFLLLERDPKTGKARVEDVKFVSGADTLRSADKALRNASYTVSFPDDGPTKLVRRGILGCYHYTGCSFVFFLPGDVHSVN